MKVPRRFFRLMVENFDRVLAQQQILDSAVANYPHLSQDSKDEQMGIWQRIAKLMGRMGSAINQILWEGTLPEDLPANMAVAEDWETVLRFFGNTGAIPKGQQA